MRREHRARNELGVLPTSEERAGEASAGHAVTARTVQVTFDCADPASLSMFWCEALGYEVPPPPPGFASWDAFSASLPPELADSASACQDPAGVGPRLFFQRVPEGKAVKNRVHLDIRAAPGLRGEERMSALEAEAERLVGLGATRLERHEPNRLGAGHIVMQDPEGNEFCLD